MYKREKIMSVLGVQTNQAFYLANTNATKANNSYNQALDRLSSGLRINNAKDDAAGLAIAETMEKDIRGLTQANRNANDGISATQIMEGALGEQLDALNRMSELAIQASSGTYTESDRAKMELEFKALDNEINRISGNTSFNGTVLLDNTTISLSIQIGTGTATSDVLSIAAPDTRSQTLGTSTLTLAGTTATNANAAITGVNGAIETISTAMATQGSQNSSLDSVISNNTVMKDSMSLAKGRIMDADFAVESANLAKSNVLLQVSQSMLAQANQQPSLVLGLIQ
jgi:flagellin